MSARKQTASAGKEAAHDASVAPSGSPPSAPFIFTDLVSMYGFSGGVVCVTLEAVSHTLGPDRSKVHQPVVVGHLRMGLATSQALRAALESAERMAFPNGRPH